MRYKSNGRRSRLVLNRSRSHLFQVEWNYFGKQEWFAFRIRIGDLIGGNAVSQQLLFAQGLPGLPAVVLETVQAVADTFQIVRCTNRGQLVFYVTFLVFQ